MSAKMNSDWPKHTPPGGTVMLQFHSTHLGKGQNEAVCVCVCVRCVFMCVCAHRHWRFSTLHEYIQPPLTSTSLPSPNRPFLRITECSVLCSLRHFSCAARDLVDMLSSPHWSGSGTSATPNSVCCAAECRRGREVTVCR